MKSFNQFKSHKEGVVVHSPFKINKMKQFLKIIGQGLESSCSSKTPEFLAAYRIFKKEFTAILKNKGCTDIEIGKGHFYTSGFFRAPTGQLWYYCAQSFTEPLRTLMYRTAKHNKEWTGGSNQRANLSNLEENLRINFVESYNKQLV